MRIGREFGEGVRVRENAKGGVVGVNGALVVPLRLLVEGLQELGWNGERGFEKPRVLLRESHTDLGSRLLVLSSRPSHSPVTAATANEAFRFSLG